MRMVARKPVRSRTVTMLLMMENQWISRWAGRNECREYFSIRLRFGTGKQEPGRSVGLRCSRRTRAAPWIGRS